MVQRSRWTGRTAPSPSTDPRSIRTANEREQGMERFFTDNPVNATYPTYTRANAGEVMPDPVSPMSKTLGLLHGGDLGWRDAYVRFGTFEPQDIESEHPICVGQFGGYLYLNMSLTRIYGVRTPGLTPEMVDFQYFGEMPGIPPYEDEARPTDEKPEASVKLAEFLQGYIFARDDLPELRQDREEVERWIGEHRPDLASCSNEELVSYARSTMPWYRRLFDSHSGGPARGGVGTAPAAGGVRATGKLS